AHLAAAFYHFHKGDLGKAPRFVLAWVQRHGREPMNQAHGIAEHPSTVIAGQGRRRIARALPGGAFVGVAAPDGEGMRIVAELPLERGRALYRDGDVAVSPYVVLRGVLRVSDP